MITTQSKPPLALAVVLSSLLCSCVSTGEMPASQEQSPSPREPGVSAPEKTSRAILFRKGPQTFGTARVFGVAAADVDLDGDTDLFIANYIGPSRLWLNDGNGLFSDSRQVFQSSDEPRVHDVKIADVNGDAAPDIFLACHGSESKVFFNDGSGRFVDSGQKIGLAADAPQSVVLGDVDADGDVDAFLTYARQPNRLWKNDGHGVFTRSEAEYGGATSPVMTLAHFNDDAFPDLFLGFIDRPGELWVNDGAGNFSDTRQAVGDPAGCDGLDTGDIDGDGDTDLVVTNVENGVRVWLNRDGAGTLIEAGPYFSPRTIRVVLLDVDDDRDLDLVASNLEEGNRLWLNEGGGIFSPTDQILGTKWGFCFAVAGLDSDSDPDLVIGSEFDGPGSSAVYFLD